jgi:hypothetical protein
MIPEFPEFKKLELSDKKDVEKFTESFHPYSDFNFVSMWCWDVKKEMTISKLHDNLVVRFNDYLTWEPFYSFLGVNKVNETSEALFNLSIKEKISPKLQLLPEQAATKLNPDKFYILENRDHFDYIFHIEELNSSEGKKYETHRNLLSRFNRRHTDIDVKNLPIHEVQNQILELTEKWRVSKISKQDDEKLRNEYEAVKRIFDFKDKNLISVCVFHKDSLIAYSINEILKDQHVLCHFAKANTEFAGVYSFLMKQTCKYASSVGKEYLNYEQDLGLPKLRYSKNSFHPKVFLAKYAVVKS